MQTQISEQLLNTPQGQEANDILRTCVHCGFCTATCPTYQLLGDELDGPRGRIYLIKQILEGNEVTEKTQTHLDRCLTCRSCETTCPSGVQYGRLIDIGRELVEKKVIRDPVSRFKRYALRKIIPYPRRFSTILNIAQLAKVLLPGPIKAHLPAQKSLSLATPKTEDFDTEISETESRGLNQDISGRKMLVLEGCVQSVATPETNLAAKNILRKLGVHLFSVSSAGCCGAVSHHLSAPEEGLDFVRRNIDAWWPYIDSQHAVEAIVVTASGCGVQVKEYGHLLSLDPEYAQKAQRISDLAKDFSEVIANEKIPDSKIKHTDRLISFHSPCTLQHGQKLDGVVERILTTIGYRLAEVKEAHLCCGSAGTYSILQSKLSQELLRNKLENLQRSSPELIATANIGCQMHLQSHSEVPVRHWIELLDDAID